MKRREQMSMDEVVQRVAAILNVPPHATAYVPTTMAKNQAIAFEWEETK